MVYLVYVSYSTVSVLYVSCSLFNGVCTVFHVQWRLYCVSCSMVSVLFEFCSMVSLLYVSCSIVSVLYVSCSIVSLVCVSCSTVSVLCVSKITGFWRLLQAGQVEQRIE